MRLFTRTPKLIAVIIIVILAIAMLSSCQNSPGAQPSTADPTAAELAAADPTITPAPATAHPASANSPSPGTLHSPSHSSGINTSNDLLTVLFINVGKADSALISYDNQHYLIDTGTSDSLPTLIKALKSMNVSQLNGVFITHPHKDHVGGLDGLLSLFDVDKVYMHEITDYNKDGSNDIVEIAQNHGTAIVALSTGDEIPYANGSPLFKVIGPLFHNNNEENDNSLVLSLIFGEIGFLFTGDMQFSEEASLLDSLSHFDVLKVGHHGKSDATSAAFMDIVNPKIAVIPTDKTSPDGHAIQTLKAADADIYLASEAEMGIAIITDGHSLRIEKRGFADLLALISDIEIISIDTQAELVTLFSSASADIDLTGWWLFSDKGNEMFFFPQGTVIASGKTLTIASDTFEKEADLYWPLRNVWKDDNPDTALLYDINGNLVSKFVSTP